MKTRALLTKILYRLKSFDAYSLSTGLITYFTFALLLAPIIILAITSFSPGMYITFPPTSFSLKHYLTLFTESRWVSSFTNSLIVATLTTCASLAVGTPAALAISRHRFKAKDLIYFMIMLPLLFPGVVIGIGLLMTLSLAHLQGTYVGFVIGHSLVATPMIIMIMVAVMIGLDPSLTDAAMDLGANRIQAFYEVTLPLIKPGIMSSALLAFVISFHEFTISYFIMSYRVITLPIVIWTSLKYGVSPAVAAVSVVMILMVAVALAVIAKTVGIERISLG